MEKTVTLESECLITHTSEVAGSTINASLTNSEKITRLGSSIGRASKSAISTNCFLPVDFGFNNEPINGTPTSIAVAADKNPAPRLKKLRRSINALFSELSIRSLFSVIDNSSLGNSS